MDWTTSLGNGMNEWDLQELSRTLSLAEIRCLRWSEIRARLPEIWRDGDAGALIYRVREMRLSKRAAKDLAKIVKELSAMADSLRGIDQQRADRRLVRLAFALPRELLFEHCLADLAHSRKLRRAGAYRALKDLGAPPELAPELIRCFQKRGEQEPLTLIARSPQAVRAVDANFLLSHLEESYWRTRVIEVLIREGDNRADDMSAAYPREFAHAAGRCRAVGCVPAIRRLISPFDVQLLRTVAWALGVLGDREGLSTIRGLLEGMPKA